MSQLLEKNGEGGHVHVCTFLMRLFGIYCVFKGKRERQTDIIREKWRERKRWTGKERKRWKVKER
jgi:hypothetical protein